VRPEYLELAATPGPNRVPVRIAAIQDQGIHTMVRLEVGASSAWAKLRAGSGTPAPGSAFACLPPRRCALYAGDRRVP
jgi:glycerol transport system ATP-binding protein